MNEFEDAPGYVKLSHFIVADDKQKLESHKIQRKYQRHTTRFRLFPRK